MEFSHISVLLDESVEGLAIKPDGIYVDGKDAAQITFLLSNYSNNSSSYLSLTYSLTADVRLCISVSVGCSANSEIPSIDIVFR